jgi:hypothetical protein
VRTSLSLCSGSHFPGLLKIFALSLIPISHMSLVSLCPPDYAHPSMNVLSHHTLGW